MLVMTNAEGSVVVVLDKSDMQRLYLEPQGTPNGKVLVAFSPDLAWTEAAFKEAESEGGLGTQKILSIIATAVAKETPHA